MGTWSLWVLIAASTARQQGLACRHFACPWVCGCSHTNLENQSKLVGTVCPLTQPHKASGTSGISRNAFGFGTPKALQDQSL